MKINHFNSETSENYAIKWYHGILYYVDIGIEKYIYPHFNKTTHADMQQIV